jgi:hypothetical protein
MIVILAYLKLQPVLKFRISEIGLT